MMTSLFRRTLSTVCEVSAASSPSARRACKLYDVGHVPYMTAWGLQKAYVEARLSGDPAQDHGDALVLVEHEPIFTLGRGGSLEHLKFIPDGEGTLPVVRVDRGGEVTYHGPGQIVGYPLISLLNFKKDIRWFVCRVEDVIIGTLKHYGFQGVRVPGAPGVWLGSSKVAAVGVAVSRWHTMHGFSLNVCPNLSHYDQIVPCGLADRGVTSMVAADPSLASNPALLADVKSVIAAQFEHVFNVEFQAAAFPSALRAAPVPVIPLLRS